tara:strand:- start:236 stop:1147 length:912 start_codon:yes stop_codon:yes gene_type:complete
MDNQANTQDTPAVDAFQEMNPIEGSDSNTSVQDAFFGEPMEQAAPEQGQPAEETPAPVEEPVSPSNDEKRFEYWQSRADKLQNELTQMQQQQQVAPVQPVQPPVQEAPKQEFPPPPARPKKPSGFNRAEAYSDPDSKSAEYLDTLEDWRGEMDEYNALKREYDNVVLQEKIQGIEQAQKQREQKRQAEIAKAQKMNEVNEYVQGHYGLSNEEAQEFIREMSDPNSLSMENLVQLYRLKKGTNAVPGQQVNAGPSDAFKQTQNAQQVPSPMGVMPSTSGETNRSEADTIMDNIINDYKKNNPFG